MPDHPPPLPDLAGRDAEVKMFAEVLNEHFLGVLAQRDAEPWYERAAWRLSRGTSRSLLDSLSAAYAAGTRSEGHAEAMAAGIAVLCDRERQSAGPYDFPTPLAVLIVSRRVAADHASSPQLARQPVFDASPRGSHSLDESAFDEFCQVPRSSSLLGAGEFLVLRVREGAH